MANDYNREFGRTSQSFVTKQDMGMAKPSIYSVDGFGRDQYIAGNNGGLYV